MTPSLVWLFVLTLLAGGVLSLVVLAAVARSLRRRGYTSDGKGGLIKPKPSYSIRQKAQQRANSYEPQEAMVSAPIHKSVDVPVTRRTEFSGTIIRACTECGTPGKQGEPRCEVCGALRPADEARKLALAENGAVVTRYSPEEGRRLAAEEAEANTATRH